MRLLRKWIRWLVMRAHSSIQNWDSDKIPVSSEDVGAKVEEFQAFSAPIPGPDEAAPFTPEAHNDDFDEDDNKSMSSWASTSEDMSRSRGSCEPRASRSQKSRDAVSWGVNLMTDEAALLAELDADIASAVAAAERAGCKDDAGLEFDYGATGSMFGSDEEESRRPRSTSLGFHHPSHRHVARDREAEFAYLKGFKIKSPPRFVFAACVRPLA
jgi:hypothetical protein